VIHACNPSLRAFGEEGELQVLGQPVLYCETLSQKTSQVQWLTSVIPTTQEVEMRRIAVQSQPGQKVMETLISVNPGMVACTCDPS
jgi:hypothetical protein